MAAIEKRTNSKGKITHRVRWRLGGTREGAWQSATFTRAGDARAFKSAVEANHHQWPSTAVGAVSAPGVVTLARLADEFLTDRAKRVRSDRTGADYRRDYDNWIEPTFRGDTMIDRITKRDVKAWVDGMADGTITRPGRTQPLSPKSVTDRFIILSSMFKYAMDDERQYVDRNPCKDVDLPKRQKKAPKGLMPAEWVALERALRLINTDAADLAEGLLASGWRWSELTALTTYGVEDYGHNLYLNMSHVVRRNASGGEVIVEEGKGQASVRRTRVDPEAADMIRRRLVGKQPGDLVFTTGRTPPGGTGGRANGLGGSRWHYSNFRNRYWNPAVNAANLTRQPTPHWLRHTHVGWLTMSGAALAELQARIGHASIKTTVDTYGRMVNDVSTDSLTAFALMRKGGQTAIPRTADTQTLDSQN
jgi:site-specific recombinase XerD